MFSYGICKMNSLNKSYYVKRLVICFLIVIMVLISGCGSSISANQKSILAKNKSDKSQNITKESLHEDNAVTPHFNQNKESSNASIHNNTDKNTEEQVTDEGVIIPNVSEHNGILESVSEGYWISDELTQKIDSAEALGTELDWLGTVIKARNAGIEKIYQINETPSFKIFYNTKDNRLIIKTTDDGLIKIKI